MTERAAAEQRRAPWGTTTENPYKPTRMASAHSLALSPWLHACGDENGMASLGESAAQLWQLVCFYTQRWGAGQYSRGAHVEHHLHL